jgi:hypothetical protein
MPDIHVPFAAVPNPAHSHAESAMWSWLERFWLVPGDDARRTVERARGDRLAAWLHPLADSGTLALLGQWYTWLFLFEDLLGDRSPGLLAEDRRRIVGHALGVLKPGAQPPWGSSLPTALADLWATTSGARSAGWRRRFLENATDGFRSLGATQASSQRAGRIPTLPEYLVQRRRSFPFDLCLDLAEIAAGTDPPGEVHRCPAFASLRESAIFASLLIDDLLRRPAQPSHEGPHGAVAVLRHHEGCTGQEAADKVGDMVRAYVGRFVEAEWALPLSLAECGVHGRATETALRCAQEYRAIMHGTMGWSLERHASPGIGVSAGRAVGRL